LNRIEINKFFSNSEEAVFPKSSDAGLPDESVNSDGGVVHDKTGLIEPHFDAEVPLRDFRVRKATDSESMHGTFEIDHLDIRISGS